MSWTRRMDDPQVLEWWADYLHVMRDGNPLGMSFAAYVAARFAMLESVTYTSSATNRVVVDRTHWDDWKAYTGVPR